MKATVKIEGYPTKEFFADDFKATFHEPLALYHLHAQWESKSDVVLTLPIARLVSVEFDYNVT